MQKRKSRPMLAAALLLCLVGDFAIGGCSDGSTRGATTSPATRPANPIVSLSPAATDLILAMGAGDALVGVSTYDSDPRVKDLPRVGDYLNVDWEQIAALRPAHLLVQMAANRVPAGFNDRATQLHVAVHRVQIDRLDDIAHTAEQIGGDVGHADAGAALARRLRDPIDVVRERVAGRPPVRTLITLSDDGLIVAGPGTYLDDLLVAAGGVNVLGADRAGYPKIDRELLLSLAPEAIIQLSPDASAAERETSARSWAAMPTLPAVKNGRVLLISDAWALLPASHAVDLAQRFAAHLHPEGN